MTKYFNYCDGEGIQCFPVVMEFLGGWHADAVATVSKLARQLASHTEETSRHLFLRLGLLLMLGNAALILNRTPSHFDAVVDGDLDFDT